jgi:hypothetical protein
MALRAVPLLALAAVLVALAAPVGASAQSAPSLGAPETQETTPAPVTTTADPNDDGLKTWQQVLIFMAGVVLLGGIALAIIGDARRNAPGRGRSDGRRTASPDGPAGLDEIGHRHRQATKQRSRQKARAARAARRRNR